MLTRSWSTCWYVEEQFLMSLTMTWNWTQARETWLYSRESKATVTSACCPCLNIITFVRWVLSHTSTVRPDTREIQVKTQDIRRHSLLWLWALIVPSATLTVRAVISWGLHTLLVGHKWLSLLLLYNYYKYSEDINKQLPCQSVDFSPLSPW